MSACEWLIDLKKVLIITYYWPPAGGPGVQRVLKFVKYLPEFGWEPIILTVENGEYPAIDESLVDEIPAGLKVYKTKSFEPFTLYKSLTGSKSNIPTHVISKNSNESFIQKASRWIRANVFIPDARIGWVPSILKDGTKVVEKEKPELIFSSSPPHSLQLGAKKLTNKTGLKWIADLRDPWTDGFWQADLPKTKYALKKDLIYEREVLNNADGITTVSKSIVKLLSSKADNNYFVIPNGYDENDFAGIERKRSDNLRITYTGSLRQSQIPFKFFESIKTIADENKAGNIEVTFIGTMHPDALELINKLELDNIVNIIPYMPHNKLINFIVNSEILLLTIPDTENNKGILTGKLFEYIGSKNFVLGFGPKEGDAAKILNELNCGVMFEYSDDPFDFIMKKYNDWLADNKPINVPADSTMYTRKNLTKELAGIFESVL